MGKRGLGAEQIVFKLRQIEVRHCHVDSGLATTVAIR